MLQVRLTCPAVFAVADGHPQSDTRQPPAPWLPCRRPHAAPLGRFSRCQHRSDDLGSSRTAFGAPAAIFLARRRPQRATGDIKVRANSDL